jgi:dUTP pyrophosphatase
LKQLQIKKLRPNAVIPQRATDGSAGYDLFACIDEPICIPAGEWRSIPTGIALGMEDSSVAAFIFGRSGLAVKHGLTLVNSVAVIDSDYRGELMTSLINHGGEPYTVAPGDRFAQLVLMPVLTPELCEVAELSDTSRGSGGFGSTGR